MLRPATPLTILLFAAFVLLLISVLSTPIIKAIPLATFGGVDFGVFGYCKGSTCSAIEIGYDTCRCFREERGEQFYENNRFTALYVGDLMYLADSNLQPISLRAPKMRVSIYPRRPERPCPRF